MSSSGEGTKMMQQMFDCVQRPNAWEVWAKCGSSHPVWKYWAYVHANEHDDIILLLSKAFSREEE